MKEVQTWILRFGHNRWTSKYNFEMKKYPYTCKMDCLSEEDRTKIFHFNLIMYLKVNHCCLLLATRFKKLLIRLLKNTLPVINWLLIKPMTSHLLKGYFASSIQRFSLFLWDQVGRDWSGHAGSPIEFETCNTNSINSKLYKFQREEGEKRQTLLQSFKKMSQMYNS